MKLDITDTVLSSFKRIYSKASIGVVGAGLAVLLLMVAGFMIGGALTSVSGVLAGLVMLITFLAYIAGLGMVSIGALRAFNRKTFNMEMFTENVFRPFMRLIGVNITMQAFIFTVFYVTVYPLILVGMMGTMGSISAMTTASTASSFAGMMPLIAAGGLIAVLLAVYVMASLFVALPRVAVNDSRMFQALDESVQSTSGNRLRVMVTLIPFILLMALAFAGVGSGGAIGWTIYVLSIIVSILYSLSLVTELNQRLN